ncbi:DNA-binding response regulator [Clostridium polyendosporum]|uniref:Stage 0 sporulation protein A homolog n=1 Tax=Clostridium polyendosporum TaxID=69208 RepID=A0A919S0C5_9CLOT|nr:response regulator [Clostridium polyendosporum]GIM28825.1 DNA-binding response regulator [Clostridium polyendosporum]
MKILIVEDEFYTRKALIKMLTDRYDSIEVIDEVENGLKAVEYIKENTPDIIITDIRMPQMNGISLVEHINYYNKNIITVIITGYAEFEYAQKAIKYGVKEYLLKPINKSKLYELFDSLEKLVVIQKNERQMEERLKEADRILVEEKINKIISKTNIITKDDLSSLLNLKEHDFSYRMVIFKQRYSFNTIDKGKIIDEIKGKESIRIFSNSSNPKEVMLICFGDKCRNKYEELQYPKQLFSIKRYLNSQNKDNVVVGVSSTFSNLNDLSRAYEEASYALNNHYLKGWGKVFEYEETKKVEISRSVFDEYYRVFKHMISEGREDLCIEAVNKIFEKINQAKNTNFYIVQDVCLKIINLIYDNWQNVQDRNEYILKAGEHQIIRFSDFNELREIQEHMNNLIKESCEAIIRQKKCEQTSVVEKVQSYLEEHYFEDVSLEKLSGIYFVNSSYLSRVFKEETGDTFCGALLKLRMNKAKELLVENKLNVSEIATLVGYNNIAYFIKTFKSYYGMTPGQYKKDII